MTLVTLNVNGRALTAEAEPRTHLADFLRETHNLTGTHIGCEHGVCGACTLIIDGEPARSCITYAVSCADAQVTTIEGLDDDEVATQLRAAFRREHALQCGFCTPGMMVSARDVVLRLPEASEHEVRVAMSGNLCRCTGYVGIVRAVLSVLAERREAGQRGASDARSRLGPVGSGHAGATTPAAGAAAQPRRTDARPAGARPTSSRAAACRSSRTGPRRRPSPRTSPSPTRRKRCGISSATSPRSPAACRAPRLSARRATSMSKARSA